MVEQEQEHCLENTCRAPNALLALDVHRKIRKPFLAHFLYATALLPALPDEELSSSDMTSSLKAVPTLSQNCCMTLNNKRKKQKSAMLGPQVSQHRIHN